MSDSSNGNPPRDPLSMLADIIQGGKQPEPMPVPEIGQKASAAVERCFATLAADVRKIAQDNIDRAEAIAVEAESFLRVLEDQRADLCRRVEEMTTKTYRASMAIRELRKLFGSDAPPVVGRPSPASPPIPPPMGAPSYRQ